MRRAVVLAADPPQGGRMPSRAMTRRRPDVKRIAKHPRRRRPAGRRPPPGIERVRNGPAQIGAERDGYGIDRARGVDGEVGRSTCVADWALVPKATGP
jgi:hypothetical protein